ncbi:Rod shape-determining protein MreD [Fulvivirga sp. M361]|uniref:Rod shape-determining protein MreD n=1 Tax=Fulvivirga sp. M361 TaxID=2594266 RepID=UPI0021048EDA|nr:Rod shape-determining protein MreD [Fulvivirga sp. M361]
MSGRIIIQVFSFFAYLLIQALVVKNFVLFDRAFCFVYIGFLLLLPIETGLLPLLFLGFITGIGADIFYDSLGIHASACVLIMFLRNYWINLLTPQGGYDTGALPSLSLDGWQWFSSYALPMVFMHHLVLFYVEAAGFGLFTFTLTKVFASTLFTFVLLFTLQYLFYNKRRG